MCCPMNGTCSLRNSACCVLITFSPPTPKSIMTKIQPVNPPPPPLKVSGTPECFLLRSSGCLIRVSCAVCVHRTSSLITEPLFLFHYLPNSDFPSLLASNAAALFPSLRVRESAAEEIRQLHWRPSHFSLAGRSLTAIGVDSEFHKVYS